VSESYEGVNVGVWECGSAWSFGPAKAKMARSTGLGTAATRHRTATRTIIAYCGRHWLFVVRGPREVWLRGQQGTKLMEAEQRCPSDAFGLDLLGLRG